MYRCPFCGLYIKHGVDVLQEHRQPGGECDQRMDDLQDAIDAIEEENAS